VYKRLNITLSDDVLARADEFARRERYTRSALIAASLDSFVAAGAPAAAGVARETAAAYDDTPTAPPSVSLEETARLLRAFFSARDDIAGAWVFGSVAEGSAGPLSDVDVAILPAPELDRAARSRLVISLMSRLPSVLGSERVDVVALPDASPVLANAAVARGVVVFGERRREVAEAEAEAVRAFEDVRPVLAEERRALRERIAGYARV
jgi:predicted nucleotidyltransferase